MSDERAEFDNEMKHGTEKLYNFFFFFFLFSGAGIRIGLHHCCGFEACSCGAQQNDLYQRTQTIE